MKTTTEQNMTMNTRSSTPSPRVESRLPAKPAPDLAPLPPGVTIAIGGRSVAGANSDSSIAIVGAIGFTGGDCAATGSGFTASASVGFSHLTSSVSSLK